MKFIEDLSGKTQDFAIACFEQNDCEALEEPFSEDEELKKRYRLFQSELDGYAGLWFIFDKKRSQDIEGPNNEMLAFGTYGIYGI